MTDDLLREPPMQGDELSSLTGSLERVRRMFAWKTGGLDTDGLQRRVGASTMTLGGLVKHMALVETDWFAVKLRGEPYGEPWASADYDADPSWEWSSAAADEPADLYALWSAAVERSRVCVAAALAEGGLDGLGAFSWPDGSRPSLRRMMIDVIEEYARHVGHADLLREAVDGLVGEDPPD
jgi:hypothetical protein